MFPYGAEPLQRPYYLHLFTLFTHLGLALGLKVCFFWNDVIRKSKKPARVTKSGLVLIPKAKSLDFALVTRPVFVGVLAGFPFLKTSISICKLEQRQAH